MERAIVFKGLNFYSMIFKGRIPSKKNSTIVIQRGSRRFHVPSEKFQAWQNEQYWLHKKDKTQLANITGIIIDFEFPDNRMADLSNKTESIMDFLVDMGIIEDDSWQKTGPVTLNPIGIRKEPVTRVFITTEEDRSSDVFEPDIVDGPKEGMQVFIKSTRFGKDALKHLANGRSTIVIND